MQAGAGHWATDAGWPVTGVTATVGQILAETTGPAPAPRPALLRHDLDAAGLNGPDARINLVPATYQPPPS
jgi:hypothetical protein